MRRFTYEEVKRDFEQAGYVLLSKKYEGNGRYLDYICAKGHHNRTTLRAFRFGKRCPDCAGVKRKTVGYVREVLGLQGYLLLDGVYINSHTPIVVSCPRGHQSKVLFTNFQAGHRCLQCSVETKKNSFDRIRAGFAEFGYSVLSENYENSYTPLEYRCPKGHAGRTTWNAFQCGRRCFSCTRTDFGEIKARFVGRGYRLLTTEYKNLYTPLEYACPEGHLGVTTWNNFKHGQGCPKCFVGKVSRISQEWLDSLSISRLEREKVLRVGSRVFKVDGFDPDTNTVYEFLGDFWHGNPDVFSADEINRATKESFGYLYEQTMEKLFVLEAGGFTVKYIWESVFRSEHAFNN